MNTEKTLTRKDASNKKLSYGLPIHLAELLCMSPKGHLADMFEETFAETKYVSPTKLALWIIGEYAAAYKKEIHVSPEKLAVIADAVFTGVIPESFGKKLLVSDPWVEMLKAYKPIDMGMVEKEIKELLEENPDMYVAYKSGHPKMEKHLMGMIMKKYAGKIDGSKAREILKSL